MSTRSYIMMELEDGSYKGIYCHSDGYLTYNGAILIDHYSEKKKVEELIALGNLSSLGEKTDPNPDFPHSFDYRERQIGVCVAYGRDRGESGQEAKCIPLKRIANDPWIEFTYVYTKEGVWKYFERCAYSPGSELRDVKEDLDEMFRGFGIKRPKNLYGFYDDEAIRILKSEQKKNKSKQDEFSEEEKKTASGSGWWK